MNNHKLLKPAALGLFGAVVLAFTFYSGTQYPRQGNSASQGASSEASLRPPVDPAFTIRHAPIAIALDALVEPRATYEEEWNNRLDQRRLQDASELRDLLKSERDVHRWMAAEALGRMKDKPSVDDLIRLLQKDSSSQVRYTVARCLAAIRDRRAIEPLVAALSDPDTVVRNVAVDSLAALRASQAIPAIEAFAKKYQYPSAQDSSMRALNFLRSLDQSSRMFVGVVANGESGPYRYLVSRNGTNWSVSLEQQLSGHDEWTPIWGPLKITSAGRDFVEFTAEWGVPGKGLRLDFRLDFPPTTTDTFDATLTDKSDGRTIPMRFTRENAEQTDGKTQQAPQSPH